MSDKFKVGEAVTVEPILGTFNSEGDGPQAWTGKVLVVCPSSLVRTPPTYFVIPDSTPDIAHRISEERLAGLEAKPQSPLRVYESPSP